MSYATFSKKRKFNRILESISNSHFQKPSNVDDSAADNAILGSMESVSSPTIKKVRLSHSPESDNTTVQPSKSSVSRRFLSSPTSLRPNFVPWDRDRFLARLETFRRVDLWSPKPSAINEVEWAKRGWSCTGVMTVECVGGCSRSVVVKFPGDIEEVEDYDIEKIEERKSLFTKLTQEYVRLITEGHGSRCPWRVTGCDDTIQRLPLSNPEIALSGLRTRYLNLTRLGSKLPSNENVKTPDGIDIDETIKILPSDLFGSSPTCHEAAGVDGDISKKSADADGTEEHSIQIRDSDINKVAFVLAFFGWDISGDAQAGLAGCGACFRRLGLWMYKPKEDGSITVYAQLDIVNEHLDYCPWVNSKTQSGAEKKGEKTAGGGGGGGRSGWEVLHQTVKNKHRRIRSESSLEQSSQEPPASPTEAGADVDDETRKARDREWWGKFRRMRQTLQVKGLKKGRATDKESS